MRRRIATAFVGIAQRVWPYWSYQGGKSRAYVDLRFYIDRCAYEDDPDNRRTSRA